MEEINTNLGWIDTKAVYAIRFFFLFPPFFFFYSSALGRRCSIYSHIKFGLTPRKHLCILFLEARVSLSDGSQKFCIILISKTIWPLWTLLQILHYLTIECYRLQLIGYGLFTPMDCTDQFQYPLIIKTVCWFSFLVSSKDRSSRALFSFFIRTSNMYLVLAHL